MSLKKKGKINEEEKQKLESFGNDQTPTHIHSTPFQILKNIKKLLITKKDLILLLKINKADYLTKIEFNCIKFLVKFQKFQMDQQFKRTLYLQTIEEKKK